MGKRTKFQIKELAQLTLNVNSKKRDDNTNFFTTHECSILPEVSYSNIFGKLNKNNIMFCKGLCTR